MPFLEALDKMSRFWRRHGINMLKEAISLPGEMSFLKEQGLHLSSFHTEDLYELFKDNMVGGPAIIFHCHTEKDQTKIRQSQYGQAARPVQRFVGYDANALYLWALSQPMPMGLFTTWTPPVETSCNRPSPGARQTSGWPGWVAASPSFAPGSTGGRSASGPGNCRWMATMPPAKPPTSFTAVTGTVIDVG